MNFSDDVIKLNPGLKGQLTGTSASKYGNVRTISDGLKFQSGREAKRCSELILLDEKHQIFGLRLQVRFPLPGGIVYVADAVYCELSGKTGILEPVIEDCKGMKTATYKLKKKLMKSTYGIEIRES